MTSPLMTNHRITLFALLDEEQADTTDKALLATGQLFNQATQPTNWKVHSPPPLSWYLIYWTSIGKELLSYNVVLSQPSQVYSWTKWYYSV